MTHEDHPVVDKLDGFRIILADSITSIRTGHDHDVLVDGSHCGINVGYYAINGRVCGMIGNDAGMGLDGSGIACISMLDGFGVPVAAVDCMSAEIGSARSTYDTGIVSVANTRAMAIGIVTGMSAREAARRMLEAAASSRGHGGIDAETFPAAALATGASEAPPRVALEERGVRLLIIDSAGSFSPVHAGYAVVDGSHLGENTGRMAVDAGIAGRIGNDAGKGLNEAGTKGLRVLESAGIPGAAVASLSAHMGVAESTYATGIVSAFNAKAGMLGIHTGMSAKEAALRMFREAVRKL
jgi:uncharacterized protein YunC (DUF1805 family)